MKSSSTFATPNRNNDALSRTSGSVGEDRSRSFDVLLHIVKSKDCSTRIDSF
jgi:hypothetical protein